MERAATDQIVHFHFIFAMVFSVLWLLIDSTPPILDHEMTGVESVESSFAGMGMRVHEGMDGIRISGKGDAAAQNEDDGDDDDADDDEEIFNCSTQMITRN